MPDSLVTTLVLFCAFAGAAAVLIRRRRPGRPPGRPAVGLGTVRSIARSVTVEVQSVSGQRFVGRLAACDDVVARGALRPGVVLLVSFDPADREDLRLADDVLAVRADFDRMLVGKGLVTDDELDLIRRGTRARGVVTGVRCTGAAREDHREVEIDLMVRRPEGGQFPAHETTMIPESALPDVTPGCVVDAYYRRGDESVVAVCVAPR